MVSLLILSKISAFLIELIKKATTTNNLSENREGRNTSQFILWVQYYPNIKTTQNHYKISQILLILLIVITPFFPNKGNYGLE